MNNDNLTYIHTYIVIFPGLDSGLGGGGLFGNTSALGGTSLGLGQLGANTSSVGSAAAGAGVHEHILTLAARPYGDTPLFKDLGPDNGELY